MPKKETFTSIFEETRGGRVPQKLPLFKYFYVGMETRRKKETQQQKNLSTMNSGGLMIAVRNNSFIDSK